ncbi:MAG: hypothetical protein FVQ83_05275 [Chloroflexi bacterium]|nr:hypothetical protein [Chloroflexota bacterium]
MLIDNTATLIIMVIVTLYLYSVRCNHTKRWVVIALGFAFFLAFKTKETTWFSVILLIGIGFDDTGSFNFSLFKKNIIYVVYGLLAGLFLFSLLYGVLLGDFLFGLSPSQIQEYPSPFETEPTRIFQESESWYDSLILVFFPVPFILYLISGLKQQGKFLPAIKLYWGLPLMTIILLTGSMLTGPFGGVSRLMLPGYALISVFAPLAIDFSFPSLPKKETIKFLGSLVIGLIFLYGLRITVRNFTNSAGIAYADFQASIINPIFLTVLLGMLITTEKFTTRTVIIPLVCLIALVSTPVLENYQQIKDTSNELVVQTRFYPFYEFGEHISFDEEMLMYVSPNIPAELGFFSKDINTLYTLFDLYFGEKTSAGNFTYSPAPEDVLDHILAGQFDFIFLTEGDWTNLDPSVDPTPQIASVCEIFHDEDKPLVFLDCS